MGISPEVPKKEKEVKNTLHLSEGTDDILNQSFYKIRNMVGKKDRKKITKELLVKAMLHVALKELETEGDKSAVISEVLKEIEGDELE